MFSEVRKRVKKTGQPPGTAVYTGEKTNYPTVITVITYDTQNVNERTGHRLEDCLTAETFPGITWINVEGLQDTNIINQLATRFNLHPLTVEDILNVDQRPKVEDFDGYLFITLKILYPDAKKKTAFLVKQLSLVIGKNFLLSFQEIDTDLFGTIRKRMQANPAQRLRQHGSDYLAYRLIDAVVDEYFIILENLGEETEKIEERLLSTPTTKYYRSIYRLKRQILLLRKAVWPMREAVSHLLHLDNKLITKFTQIYLRDVYDHTVQAIDTLETFRDMLSGMLDMYLSSMTNRMNEIMKTLTIITTIFIPITAIASVYGMNFSYIPGLHSFWGFAVAIAVMVLIAIGMMIYFRKKKWL